MRSRHRAATIFLLLSCALHAEETHSLSLAANDDSIVLLDRLALSEGNLRSERPPVQLPPSTPGTVFVKHPDDSETAWSEVRWIIRFPIKDIKGPVKQATLQLWAQSHVGETEADLTVHLIHGAQTRTLASSDRIASTLGEAMSFEFPAKPGLVELDVTALVNIALTNHLAYAAFRIEANSTEQRNERTAGRYYLGGFENSYNWPEYYPPRLDLTLP